ncbi:acetate--CoA ligase [Iamia sp. SCSIO 61187]|uniref:acetate--CoA ligase n=1 Tax=Iamia sp. SCSIO 61187 TaxID=2722752 RepID=UPI001C62591D|nr:acetate--CoA ligase [Iamia sp. SCSIO 61187]QYG93530.1 acetate--CoA ligase [Iamia sp. SCSIO 61187]
MATGLAAARSPWADAWDRLDGLPDGGGTNIAHEAVDRHAAGPRRDHVAVRWVHRDGTTSEATYAALAATTARFANVLRGLGVRPGERVATLLPRVPEMMVAALGTLKARSVLCPLFSAFGPEPVRQRLERGDAVVLVTTRALYDRKVAPVRDRLPALRHVLVVGDGADAIGGQDLRVLLDAASPVFAIEPTDPEETALLHFTSGTTGAPKGAVHVHAAVVAHHETGRSALDLHPDDVFWCTADPGWVTGTSYGIIAPLTHGVTSIVDEGDLDADRWYRILQDQGVTVWYTAPTALRMLRRAGAEAAAPYDLRRLRLVASVGEPLDPEVATWGQEVLGVPVRDTWWQTETGSIMIATRPADPVRPGSMGRPLPGVEAALLRRGPDGRAAVHDGTVEVLDEPDEVGELALLPGWPSIFRGYLHDVERWERCFAGGWYLTGDLARRDADGAYWFVGRADDVITSAGHLIGPFEVESALTEHPAVVEAGVIGIPDPVAGEVVKAFVTLRSGVEPSEDLRRELLGLARRRLGPAVAPRHVAFDQHLPHTRSGKVVRRLLRARELGLPEGDTSSLEGAVGTALDPPEER